MSSSELISFYNKRAATFGAMLSEVKDKILFISNLRIASALLFVGSVYLAFSHSEFVILAGVLLAVFVWLVMRHSILFDRKTHLQNLVKVNQLEEQAIKGDYSGFDTGSKFIDPHHPYSHDLDIFGDGSLFQAVNRCNTIYGKKQMAQRLSYPQASADEIYQTHQAVQELAVRTDFRQDFQAAGMEIDEHETDRNQLLEWLQQPARFYGSSFYRIMLIILPIVTIAAVVGAFWMPQLKSIAIGLVLFQWIIAGYHGRRVTFFHEFVSKRKQILEMYGRLLQYFEKEKFESPILFSLSGQAHEAHINVSRLATLVGYLNARLNFLTALFVNSLLLYDLQCVYRLEKWKEDHGAKLDTWLKVVYQTDVLCSLATFRFNNPHFIFPKIDSKIVIHGNSVGHPLLRPEECVTNDIMIGEDQSILIITGANMAGKSTFLRTVGVNVVLTLAGAPVYAKTFSCPVISLRSGMRTADSLKDHQSYFYAELDRLKAIMDELRQDRPLLILLDEILKGTNSTDKQSGSIALVKQLIPHPCLALIATHDIVLGELESQFPNIRNYFFEANIENDQLSFDYKLKAGVAQKMNATFLMKKMGIIPRD